MMPAVSQTGQELDGSKPMTPQPSRSRWSSGSFQASVGSIQEPK